MAVMSPSKADVLYSGNSETIPISPGITMGQVLQLQPAFRGQATTLHDGVVV